jgi:hypothetical protein
MKRTLHLFFALALPAFSSPAALAAGSSARPADRAGAEPVSTVPSIREVSAQIAALAPAERAQATASLRFLTASCPYTRAAMLLPVVLRDAVRSIPVTAISPEGRAELAALNEALALHVGALEALGVEVKAPTSGDALFGQPAASVPDRAALRRSAEPITTLSISIAAITPIAGTIEAQTQAQIEVHSDRVEAATGVARPCPRGPWAVQPGHPWTMGMQLNEAHDALVRLAPTAVDAGTRAELDALIGLMDALGAANQASRATRTN